MQQGLLFPDAYAAESSAGIVPHPIPYQGSKRQLATKILTHFPHRIQRLVEPFAGSAALSLAAACHGRATSFWVNDAHRPLIDLWQAIIDRPDELSAKYALLWEEQTGRERTYYDEIRAEFNESHQPELFLYLLARCVKAAIRYNSSGEFNNSPDNRRKGALPAAMRARVAGASRLLRGRTRLTAYDYTAVVAECTEEDLIYMDPPYQGVSKNRDSRYAPQIHHDAFCDVLNDLNKRNCCYVVSYDGRTGAKVYGRPMPASLGLGCIELYAGRSTTATLQGKTDDTYESLYLSPTLARSVSVG
jgi:DNA adenine methylase